ncbi:MAG: hypothetical protein ABIK99_02020 [candidate division WOR-3 bacterium]
MLKEKKLEEKETAPDGGLPFSLPQSKLILPLLILAGLFGFFILFFLFF